MKYVIISVAILTVCLSISLAAAQSKVVVIPMGGKKGVVAKTGQTICYDPACSLSRFCNQVPCDGTGQDGELQKGMAVTPRFENNGNGTVTDRLTGLIWLREGNCNKFFFEDNSMTNDRPWQYALEAANKLSSGYCGLIDDSVPGDWRLPNLRELQSLVDYSQNNLCLSAGHPFLNTMPANYWSSTTDAENSGDAWRVNFHYGNSYDGYKYDYYYVRPVRGGQ